ncbi:MAG: redoxin domain-containing protein [Chloroflexota bacterium]
MYVQLDKRIIRMPNFGDGEWLQAKRPLTRQSLHGQVILIDFWDYACVNCLRTLPYLVRWHERYHQHGLTIIGIHSPEFQFAQVREQVETAVSDYQLPYPILLDNNYETWNRFATKAWPTKFVVDPDGYIRLKRQGEGYYREVEKAIQTLLRQKSPNLLLPDLLPPLREEDTPGAVCYRPTPELYGGYQGGLFGGGLGNAEGYMPHNSVFYQLPKERSQGQFFADGIWKAWPEAFAFAGQNGGRILLPYSAVGVNAVLAPTADPV